MPPADPQMLEVKVGGGRYHARLPAMANWVSDIRTNRTFPSLGSYGVSPSWPMSLANSPLPPSRESRSRRTQLNHPALPRQLDRLNLLSFTSPMLGTTSSSSGERGKEPGAAEL